jgi:hypothetical protein
VTDNSFARRTVSLALDSAALFAPIEASILLWNAPALRSLSRWTVALFASVGVGFTLALVPALALVALPIETRARRALSGALGALVLVFAVLYARGSRADVVVTAALALAGCALVRRAIASVSPARSSRLAALALSLSIALGALGTEHALRTYGAAHGVLLSALAQVGGALRPTPALVAIASEPAPRAPVGPLRVPLVLVFTVNSLRVDAIDALPALRVLSRNAARLVDARAIGVPMDGSERSILPGWERRFDGVHDGVRFVRCAGVVSDEGGWPLNRPPPVPVDRCAREALARPGPLVLWVALDGVSPSLLTSPNAVPSYASECRRVNAAVGSVLRDAHARTPLSTAVVALASEWSTPARAAPDRFSMDDERTRSVLLLSAPGVRPGPARGAVRVDELGGALETLAFGGAEPGRSALLDLAMRRAPYGSRAVTVAGYSARGRRIERVVGVYTARYGLVLAPSRWGVSLVDLSADPSERVNLADALPDVLRSMAARAGASL